MSRNTVRAGLSELDRGAAAEAADSTPSRRRPQAPFRPGSVPGEGAGTPPGAGEARRPGKPAALDVAGRTVNRLLHSLGCSLRSNRKTVQGRQHSDRGARFRRIDRRVRAFQKPGQPAIPVGTKRKEPVGPCRNGGREWRPKGSPEKVRVHDFPDPDPGKAVPCGVYGMTADRGRAVVGADRDTASFAVESVRRWWPSMGRPLCRDARRLLITAGGCSSSSRSRLWKLGPQRLADGSGLKIPVCRLPPGTSRWNRIEHRMFCHITRNRRGRPLVSCRPSSISSPRPPRAPD